MTDVVLAVHGVSNRSRDGFRNVVGGLAGRVGRTLDVDMREVFWGDLAPAADLELRSIPTPDDANPLSVGSRSTGDRRMRAAAPAMKVPPSDSPDEVVDDLVARTVDQIEARVLDRPDEATVAAIREAVNMAAAEGNWLGVQADLSDALAQVVMTTEPAGTASVDRGLIDGVKKAVRQVITTFDREAAKLLGNVLQHSLRGAEVGLSKTIATTLGDILAYDGAEPGEWIRGRLDEAYDAARQQGTVHVVAHSLGALVAVEWLLGAPVVRGDGQPCVPPDERRIGTLVTFGAQVSLFCELHGLLGSEGDLAGDRLPLQVAEWHNVWHQLDPVAFVMGRVLSIGDGLVRITDHRLDLASVPTSPAELGFHSSYWNDDTFCEWLTGLLPR